MPLCGEEEHIHISKKVPKLGMVILKKTQDITNKNNVNENC
jgi:hypothetical protein